MNYSKPASQGEILNDPVFVDFVTPRISTLFLQISGPVLVPNNASKYLSSHWQIYFILPQMYLLM